MEVSALIATDTEWNIMSMLSNEKLMREKWIDIVKAILIIAVVWGHVYNNGIFRRWLYSFHVPGFFLISGVCFKYYDFKIYIKKKIKGIVVPYAFFSITSILFWKFTSLIYPKITALLNCSIIHNVGVALYGNSKPDLMKYNTLLWFLPCLFSTCIISYIIKTLAIKHGKSIEYLGCLFCAGIGVIFSTHPNLTLPWHIETGASMSVWFLLGSWLSEIKFTRYIDKMNSKILVGIILLIGGFVLENLNTCVLGVRNDSYGNLLIYYISSALQILGIIVIAVRIHSSRVLENIGQNTLGILSLHKFVIVMIQLLLEKARYTVLNSCTIWSTLVGFAITVVSILVSLIITRFIKIIFPWALGVSK